MSQLPLGLIFFSFLLRTVEHLFSVSLFATLQTPWTPKAATRRHAFKYPPTVFSINWAALARVFFYGEADMKAAPHCDWSVSEVFRLWVFKPCALLCLPLQPSAGRWSPATSARCSRAESPSCTTSSNTPRSRSTTPASPWTVTSAPWSPSTGSPCLQR